MPAPRIPLVLLYLAACGIALLLLDCALGVQQIVSSHVTAIRGREIPLDAGLVRQAALGAFALGFILILLAGR